MYSSGNCATLQTPLEYETIQPESTHLNGYSCILLNEFMFQSTSLNTITVICITSEKIKST